MAGDTCMELWLNSYRWDALQEALASEHTNIEDTMQEYLLELYREKVPAEQMRVIEQRIKTERLEQLRQEEESRVFSVFHIREHGQERLLMKDGSLEFLDAAIRLRRYLRNEIAENPAMFSDTLLPAQSISEEKFDELVNLRLENTGKVTGAFEIDLDKGQFSTLHIMDGWQTFRIKDISTAAYHATRQAYLKQELRWQKFLDYLVGKQIVIEAPALAEQTVGMVQTM